MALSTLIAAPLEVRGKKVLLVNDPAVDLLPDGLDKPLRHFKIKTAASILRRNSASLLLKARYGWRGYQTVTLPTDPQANRITLTALEQDTVIGTITVGLDGEEGLAADDVFNDVIEPLREQGKSLCEFTKLAVDPMSGTQRVLAALFHVAFIVGHRMRGYQKLLIEVNPRHVRYYERMVGATVLAEARTNRTVNAPAVLMGLDFDFVREQIAQYAGQPGKPSDARSIYPFFFSMKEEAGIIAKLQATSHKTTSVPVGSIIRADAV